MKKLHLKFPPLILIVFAILSCTKMDLKKDRTFETDNTLLPGWSKAQLTSADFIPQDGDSIERITTLGVKLTNPYLIPNMQQAYTNLGLSSSLATITNKYVRFKPTTVDKLATLDSITDAQGLEIFDTPVDYVVTYEGDYYQDPSISDSLPTWQYAVVPPTFVFPSGITYEILAQIHIPGDSYTAVETEAERLASLQDSLNGTYGPSMNGNIQPDVADECDPCFVWDPIARQCVPTGQCGGNPPPPAPDAAVPAGNIFVFDTNLGMNAGLRKARVVARRWFKIERVYTDINGHFQFTKRFKHKVRILEKFKNDDARIYGIRGLRTWQMLFPIKRTLGIYSGNKSNIPPFVNAQTGPVNSKGNRYWAGATTHNAVQEHRGYSTQFGFSLAPATINIYVTNWAFFHGSGSTPLFHKRFLTDLPLSFINTYLVGATVPVYKLTAVFARVNVDMVIDYNTVNEFSSDFIKENVYHEMSHASHYTKAGTGWYTQFVNAELAEIATHPGANDPLNPYGNGMTGNSPIIALGEGWAYHMGHFLADQRYGVSSSCHTEQVGHGVCPNPPTNNIRSNLLVLENYIPGLTTDPFHWIPIGLMEDLIDNGTEPTQTLVNDQVSGFTISQIFSALQSDVTTVPAYRARFIQQNPGNQTTQITTLFTSYNY